MIAKTVLVSCLHSDGVLFTRKVFNCCHLLVHMVLPEHEFFPDVLPSARTVKVSPCTLPAAAASAHIVTYLICFRVDLVQGEK